MSNDFPLSIGWTYRAALLAMTLAIGMAEPLHADEEAQDRALDQSTKPIGSCSFDEMLVATKGIPTVDGMDATAICATMARSIGHSPPTNVLRAGLKVSSLISIRSTEWGLKTTELETANQLMKIIRLRGLTDPKRMISTFDTVWKIFAGTTGAVTPSDLVDLLRSAGPAAQILSDDGLISAATLVWEQKKAADQ